MEAGILGKFRTLRDYFGVEKAVLALRDTGEFSLEEVDGVLKTDGYNPIVTKVFGVITLSFSDEEERKRNIQSATAFNEAVGTAIRSNLSETDIEALAEKAENLSQMLARAKEVIRRRHRVEWKIAEKR